MQKEANLTLFADGVQRGAPGGIRTHDPQLRKLVLYPLSYGRICGY